MAIAEPNLSFLSGESGTLAGKRALVAKGRDVLADAILAPTRMLVRDAAHLHPPRRRVLAIGVARAENAARAVAIERELRASRHDVRVALRPPRRGLGKWENLNAILAGQPPNASDWLIVVDDDVVLPKGFLDLFLFCAERHDLVLAQPAHRFQSHAAWRVTRRRPGVVARATRFVEIGPVTALRRPALDLLLPFPPLRMGWGLDAHWSALAQEKGWRIGVVDLTPIRHLQPVAAAYPREDAIAEAHDFLATRPFVRREEARTVAVYRDWR